MPLCKICQAIPFNDLPPFPEGEYIGTSTGLEHVHPFMQNTRASYNATSLKVRHHTTIEGLQEAASDGCELCLLIQSEAAAMLAELDSLGGERDEYSEGRPNFDMWLTKRPYGGQGFWVLSECSAGVRGLVIVPVAAFSFAVTQDNVLAGTFRGRPVKQQPDTQTLQRLIRWNAECEQDHECCQGLGPMPSLLIDVQVSKSADAVKLVELDARARRKFIALTYTSESRIISYWEDNTLPEDGSIRLIDLPKTFQDAIHVTRILGIQYIWIDSLCISSSPREWARDSEQAGSVYANAYLTISATGSESKTDGLFFPRTLRTSTQIPYETIDGITKTVLVSTLPLIKEVNRRQYLGMEQEPISKGVWSFQERVLSRRTVHFASDQIYFECLSHFVSEDGLCERLRYHTAAETLPEGTDHYRRRAIKATPLSRWFAILWDYAQRQPTNPLDKLPGLSNVARAFQLMLDDSYVVGYWKRSLIESLCWQSLHCKPAGDSSAPSWSWVSVDGMPYVGLRDTSVHFLATVVNTQVSLLNDTKPFSRVAEASILIEAPLLPLSLIESPGHQGFINVRTDSGDEGGFRVELDATTRSYAASAEILGGIELFALVLVQTHKKECLPIDCNIEGTYRVLIVTPVDALGLRVKRLGLSLVSSLSFGYYELSKSHKTVTLV